MTIFILATTIKLISSLSLFLGLVFCLYLLQRLACSLSMRHLGSKSIYLTATVGVITHELSHFLICYPFFHKVDEVAFFKPDLEGQTLGYVTHSYNPKSIWQVIGNFFIGVAPLAGGTLAIYLLTSLLLPNGQMLTAILHSSSLYFSSVDGLNSFITSLFTCLWDLIKLLSISIQDDFFRFSLWAYLTGSIALYMSPSPADMRGSVKGILLLFLILSLIRILSESMGELVFDRISVILLSLSVSYSLCILLAAGCASFIFLISIFVRRKS